MQRSFLSPLPREKKLKSRPRGWSGRYGFLLAVAPPKVMAVGALSRMRIYVSFLPGFRKSIRPPNLEFHCSRSPSTFTGQTSLTPPTSSPPPVNMWRDELCALEDLLNYRFNNKRLLEEALTHSTCTDAPNYERLEFIGDAALGLAVSDFFYLVSPNFGPGKLSRLRSANVSTQKLARAAVRLRLYKYVRLNDAALNKKVREFVDAVETEVYCGTVKAPKVLADIVESVAAAVYIDCDFNLKTLWVKFRTILEPIVMLDVGEEQSQPVTMLFEACHKEGKQVHIRHWRKEEKDIFTVFVDGKFVVSSEHKENAKVHAAEAALQKLSYAKTSAKQKLNGLCVKKRWPKPSYRIVKEVMGRIFICSVTCELPEGILCVEGDEKSKVKEAEHSAASKMLLGLADSKYT